MEKFLSIVGARPNFIKIAPLYRELTKFSHCVVHKICHTGQHFDEKMSEKFFHELELPEPVYNLGVSSGSHALQTAGIMLELEKVLYAEKPDLIIVVGDVNSTLAACITAAKMNIKIAHIESGLRSFDRTMPEEINRVLTDTLPIYLSYAVSLLPPLGYFDFGRLVKSSSFVITDSGGIQEECTYLRIPCFTFRDNTERPVTVEKGTNRVIGTDFTKILSNINILFNRPDKISTIPELWDGKTAMRIVNILLEKQ
ncbi:MAG: UDP-N-acetylglucosamine 2-epimerase [Bacteroidia bacterium]|nr:UDP-N-acetylglucosamine 2-epimerase [Bacteroidia bacterium]